MKQQSNEATNICANCGADYGLHHFESERCPKNGIEEWREGKVQEWENTRFEDSGLKAYAEKAVNEYDKLKADNEVLLNALKELNDSINGEIFFSDEKIESVMNAQRKAVKAINQVENK